MKKLLLGLAFAGSLSVSAQEKTDTHEKIKSSHPITFGIKAGFNASTFTSTTDTNSFDGSEKLKPGFNAGVFMNIPVAEKFSIQPELLFSQLGSKSEERNRYTSSNYSFTNEAIYTTTLNYLVLPIMVQYNILPQLYVEAGPEFGILLGGKTKGDQTFKEMSGNQTFTSTDSFSNKIPKDYYNTFNFGIGIGAGYYFTQNLAATARFTAGITEVYKHNSSDNKIRNNAFQIGLAYQFK